jgi:hypothetical protein
VTPDFASSPDGPQEGRLAFLPAFESGGFVQKTGIALVHEGEYILPAPGSEAQITSDGPPGTGPTVHYYFPIEVEVIGTLSRAQIASIAAYVYEELRDTLPV